MLTAFDDARIFGAGYGEGEPSVLALHGWRRTHKDFERVLTGGDEVIPSIALDLPGFGATPPPPEPWGSPEYADAVAPVLEGLDRPVVVVGHSLGGRVAVHLAARHPERVSALVLTGAPLFRPEGAPARPALGLRLARRLHKLGIVPESGVERFRQKHGSADYNAAQGVMRSVLVRMLAEDYVPALQRIRVPVELVWGDNDTAASLRVAREIERLLVESGAPCRLTVCPGAGHMTPQTAPEQLRAAIERHRR